MSRSTNSYKESSGKKAVKEVVTAITSDENISKEEEEFVLNTFSATNNKGLFVKLNIVNSNNIALHTKCQLDTGASCNIIGIKDLKNIEETTNINDTNTKLTTIEGNQITPIGTTYLQVEKNEAKYKLLFYVIKNNHCPLLSLQTCQSLKLIEVCKKVGSDYTVSAYEIIKKYDDVFEGLGKLKGDIKLEIDNGKAPKTEPPRRIPIALRDQLRDTLNEMEAMDVITKENEHTDWTSNIVLVKKNNKLRVCIDPKELNEALKDIKYQLPTVEEVFTELADAKVFSILDAKHGFWQLQLDERSSKLTSFWTPFGKYRFKRVPFGIKPAMEIFQMR